MATQAMDSAQTHIRTDSIIIVTHPYMGTAPPIPTATVRGCKCGWLLPGLCEVLHPSDLGHGSAQGSAQPPASPGCLGLKNRTQGKAPRDSHETIALPRWGPLPTIHLMHHSSRAWDGGPCRSTGVTE
ncbi:hypothetical protein OTU49_008005 [Cherax quadricarinatus]|uniref:Uncharacterized protein n=1 Tax=Cherax quadricarinatus TaxID=27406 RepID=A0AAW0WEI0_CHEQU